LLKRFLIGIIIPTFVICHLSFVISTPALGQHVYLGLYWITGAVQDPDSKGTDGRQVVFFRADPATGYAMELSGPSGLSGQADRYLINAYKDWRLAVAPGTYKVGIVKGGDNYGADPVTVTVTGKGFDAAPDLLLAYGRGLGPLPGTGEPAPRFKIWFNNRLYQQNIYGTSAEGKKPFIVAETGKIKLEVSIDEPYQINEAASYAIRMLTPVGETKTFDLSALASMKASATGVKPFSLETDYPEPLVAGADETVYTFTFNAASKGTLGAATAVARSG
jgi:hypothetical protein